MWTLRAAAAQDHRDVHVPPPYLAGMAQLARNLAREAEMKA
jgi:anthraniloyl-CoA monooxygenase